MDKIAVIIPTYNGAALLRDCLASIIAQDEKPAEIIVVDNGSTDNTCDVIKSSHTHVSLVKLPINEGFSRAVNKGIEKSQAELLFVLNNDVRLERGCIAALRAAAADKSYGSFAPLVFDDNGINIHSAGLMFSNRGYGNRSNRRYFEKYSHKADVFCCCCAAALYRRTALQHTGLLNEDFFLFFEDLELGFRLQLRGHRCLLVPSAKAFHIGGATAHRFFRLKVEQSLANSLTTFITCAPRSWLLKDAVRTFRFYCNLTIACWRRGYGKSVIAGLFLFIMRLPKTIWRRQNIQNSVSYDSQYLRQLLYTDAIDVNFNEESVQIPL